MRGIIIFFLESFKFMSKYIDYFKFDLFKMTNIGVCTLFDNIRLNRGFESANGTRVKNGE